MPQRLDALLGAIDVLLTPAAFGEAPVGMPAFAGVPLYQIWTTLHVPAISIPVFKGPAGMPIGAQLIGKRHDEAWASEPLLFLTSAFRRPIGRRPVPSSWRL